MNVRLLAPDVRYQQTDIQKLYLNLEFEIERLRILSGAGWPERGATGFQIIPHEPGSRAIWRVESRWFFSRPRRRDNDTEAVARLVPSNTF